MAAKKEIKKRLQFDFTENAIKRVDDIIKKTEAASRAEVVRNALKIYLYLIDKIKDGYVVKIEKAEDIIIIPSELL